MDAYAYEYEEDPGQFRISRDFTEGPLTVYYTTSGAARPDADYYPLDGTVVIPDGEASVLVDMNPYDDSVADEGEEDVILTLTPDSGYVIDPSRKSDNVTIYDNESSGGAVRIEATDDFADEFFNPNPDPGEFTITRSSAYGSLSVTFTVGGIATEGSDYEALTSYTVDLADGQYAATIPINPSRTQ